MVVWRGAKALVARLVVEMHSTEPSDYLGMMLPGEEDAKQRECEKMKCIVGKQIRWPVRWAMRAALLYLRMARNSSWRAIRHPAPKEHLLMGEVCWRTSENPWAASSK